MTMKIKIKPITSILSFLLPVCYMLIIVLVVWGIKVSNFFSWSEAWGMLLQAAKKESLLFFILLKILPWLFLFFLVAFVWETFQKKKLRTRSPRITSISFEKDGVILQQNLSAPAVFLPYGQTDFSLCVLITVSYNKHHQPIQQIVGVEMSFASSSGHFSAQHRAGLSLIQKILDEGKKFHSFATQVKPAYKDEPSNQDEKDFILFLQEQLDNYRRYGLMQQVFPAQLTGLLILGLVTGGGCLFFAHWVWQILQETQPSMVMLSILVIFLVLTLLICCWCIYKYITAKHTAKRLAELKNQAR